MGGTLKKIMENKWVRFIFSLSIIGSTIPSIGADLTYGHQGTWTHYGMVLVGILYLMESIFWILDIWES